MPGQPLISIVTPSFNQGRYLRETLQSLVAQNYSNLEVIVQDGGSTDGAVAIAQEFVDRFPSIFKLFVEKDRGQADALNRGFARTRGDILGFLNSDDTLYPGCLESVAREIDPNRGRYVVMGRCLFTGEDSVYVGVEHPCSFVSHFDQLAIWKRGFNAIPQPSVFWHREAWEKDGGFDVNESHAIDYDLFCRFSRHYRFHPVNELWSTYRMHAVSKSFQRSELEILELSILISRRYWGSWLSLTRWRCEFSFWMYGQQQHEKARHHARRCEDAVGLKKRSRVLIEFMLTAFYSPKMARDRLLVPFAGAKGLVLLQKILIGPEGGFTGRYDADLWVGPLYRQQLTVPKDACRLVLILQHSPQDENHSAVTVSFNLNKKTVTRKQFTVRGQSAIEIDVKHLQGRKCVLELRSDRYFVPRMVHKVPDDRRLSIQLIETHYESVEYPFTGREDPELWIGPLYRQELFVPQNGRRVIVELQHAPLGNEIQSVKTTLYLDQKAVASGQYIEAGRYALEANVDDLQGRICILELRSDAFHLSKSASTASGSRKRSIQLIETRVDNAKAEFAGRYQEDSYIGPYYSQGVVVPAHAVRLILLLQHKPQRDVYGAVNVTLYLNRQAVTTVECREPGQYVVEADLRTMGGTHCLIELRSDNSFVPRAVHNVADDRVLSVQLLETRIEPAEDGSAGH